MYLFLSNRDSASMFPDNSVVSFECQLPSSILCGDDSWVMGLVDINLPRLNVPLQTLSVLTNLCEASMVDGSRRPILRRLQPQSEGGYTYVTFHPVVYVPVNARNVSQVRVDINSSSDSCPAFGEGDAFLTIHFKRTKAWRE